MAEYSPWGVQPIEAYASAPSVVAGAGIAFHVSVAHPSGAPVLMEVYRSTQLAYDDSQFGLRSDRIYQGDWRERITSGGHEEPLFRARFAARSHLTPVDASRNGCRWPQSVAWDVPADLRSGVYLARFSHGIATTYALFVVRPADPGRQSRILGQLSYNTHQAYNPFGGLCFYPNPISRPGDPVALDTVSFERPCQLWDFILYEQSIVAWLDRNYGPEWCTNVDLDGDEGLLEGYQLFISCGHDEYWSPVMRDRIDAFASSGGNVMFLTGNTCFRPVDVIGTRLIRTADTWGAVGRPEALTTGLNFSAGRWSLTLPTRGFTVRLPSHWMLDGTSLKENMTLGEREGVIGYEADATVQGHDGRPTDPTPPNYLTVATADLSDWVDFPGRASLGLFWKDDQGVVMSAGTTGWGRGLRVDTGNVDRVMRNLVGRLRRRVGVVYAVTTGGDLWWYRDRSLDGGGDVAHPRVIGHGGWDGFVALFSGGNGAIYAVTHDGDLLRYADEARDGSDDVAHPQVIGRGGWDSFVTLFAADGVIHGVTPGGDLERYVDEGDTSEVAGGDVISHGSWNRFATVFSPGEGIIYAVTADGDLVWHAADETSVSVPRVIGHGGWNDYRRVFSGGSEVIYAVTLDGNLVSRRDRNRDGTGAVGDPELIGHGGWNQFLRLFSGS